MIMSENTSNMNNAWNEIIYPFGAAAQKAEETRIWQKLPVNAEQAQQASSRVLRFKIGFVPTTITKIILLFWLSLSGLKVL